MPSSGPANFPICPPGGARRESRLSRGLHFPAALGARGASETHGGARRPLGLVVRADTCAAGRGARFPGPGEEARDWVLAASLGLHGDGSGLGSRGASFPLPPRHHLLHLHTWPAAAVAASTPGRRVETAGGLGLRSRALLRPRGADPQPPPSDLGVQTQAPCLRSGHPNRSSWAFAFLPPVGDSAWDPAKEGKPGCGSGHPAGPAAPPSQAGPASAPHKKLIPNASAARRWAAAGSRLARRELDARGGVLLGRPAAGVPGCQVLGCRENGEAGPGGRGRNFGELGRNQGASGCSCRRGVQSRSEDGQTSRTRAGTNGTDGDWTRGGG